MSEVTILPTGVVQVRTGDRLVLLNTAVFSPLWHT